MAIYKNGNSIRRKIGYDLAQELARRARESTSGPTELWVDDADWIDDDLWIE